MAPAKKIRYYYYDKKSAAAKLLIGQNFFNNTKLSLYTEPPVHYMYSSFVRYRGKLIIKIESETGDKREIRYREIYLVFVIERFGVVQ